MTVAILAAVFACLGLFGAAPADAQVNIEDLAEKGVGSHENEADVDNRTGSVAPTDAQRRAARELGSSVRWNDFGTPHSWTNPNGFLATGVRGEKAPEAARTFLADNAEAFGLSEGYMNNADRLQLVEDTPLTGSNGHAVFFRQQFGDLSAVKDGSVTVSLTGEPGGPWKVAYVSSSLTKEEEGASLSAADASLSASQAWARAAGAIGEDFGVTDITDVNRPRSDNDDPIADFTRLDVAGLPQDQRVRLTAVPVPGQGVVPAYETIFLNDGTGAENGGTAEAFTSFVNADTGRVLFRANNVEQLMQAEEPVPPPPTSQPFQGTYTENQCGENGPFTVPEGTSQISVTANAANPANDIVLRLVFGGEVVAESDTVTTPESILYEPSGGVEAGDYTVRVCDFKDTTAPLPPNTYTGFFLTTAAGDTPEGVPYPPKWNYFSANPEIGADNESYPSADTRRISCWNTPRYKDRLIEDCQFDVANSEPAHGPWDTNPRANFEPTFTTTGNNAVTAESWYGPVSPGPTGFRPTDENREYNYDWGNRWYNSTSTDQGKGCSPTEYAAPGGNNNDISAAVASLFAQHNRMHDWSYNLGFTEQAFNLQQSNFGTTQPEGENDPEIGDAQAGAVNGGAPSYLGRDNANQITLNDGIAPITNMYLWQPIAGAFYAPCVDGDFDMSVIAHEYGHAIQNRMVAGPDEGLSGLQATSMGESWSDLTAIEYLYEYGFEPGNGANRFAVGPYVTGNKQTGIRNYGMNKSPLNYADIEYDPNGVTSPHADGEIWSATNFDIRQLLASKYAAEYSAAPGTDAQMKCADGKRPASKCPGNRRWVQIFHDAFLMQQSEVSFLDARDAYLAADRMRFFGKNQKELWLAFARHGMGESAKSDGSDDRDPTPGFASPRENNARITFRPVTADGERIKEFRVYVGEYEARAVPSARGRDATEEFAPGRYEFVVEAPGYGLRRYEASFSPGQVATKKITMQTNWASLSEGAGTTKGSDGTVGDDGDRSSTQLIDETEETNWRADGPVEGQQVTVNLRGGSHLVSRVNVSAFLRPTEQSNNFGDTDTQSRFSALRGFEILTCRATASNDCTNPDRGFKEVAQENAAFEGTAPRPLAPQLNFKSFDVDDTNATHVQLRAISNQCTGNPAYQGDQDADPANNSDCVTGSAEAGSPQGEVVRAAELEVFSR